MVQSTRKHGEISLCSTTTERFYYAYPCCPSFRPSACICLYAPTRAFKKPEAAAAAAAAAMTQFSSAIVASRVANNSPL